MADSRASQRPAEWNYARFSDFWITRPRPRCARGHKIEASSNSMAARNWKSGIISCAKPGCGESYYVTRLPSGSDDPQWLVRPLAAGELEAVRHLPPGEIANALGFSAVIAKLGTFKLDD
jgi:hypothetical protein